MHILYRYSAILLEFLRPENLAKHTYTTTHIHTQTNTQSGTILHTDKLTRIDLHIILHTVMLRTHKDTQKHLEAHNNTNAKYPNKITSNHIHTHTYTPRHERTRRDTLLQTHTDLDTQRPTRTQKDTNSWHKSTKKTIISKQIPALAYIHTQNTVFIDITLGQLRLIELKDTWLYMIC